MIASLNVTRPLRIAVDGRTASGKTTFSDELASAITQQGRKIIRTSIDGFHRPKIERYARGRYSPEGYYFDARDLMAIRTLLLDPLGPNGNRQFRTASFDLEKDIAIDMPVAVAPPDSVLIVDGTFLLRTKLAGGWDVTLFLDTSEEVAENRGITRDVERLGGPEATHHLYAERYRPAFTLYEGLCRPKNIADAVIDNNDLNYPVIHIKVDGRLTSVHDRFLL
jgi:uridine kinase